MAFMNCFFNFNINFAQPRFGFNFGCFTMPNFFQSMPFFNCFNSFSPTSWQLYNNFMPFNTPSVFNTSTNLNMQCYTNNFSTFEFNNSWQSSFTGVNFDSFNYTAKPSGKKKDTKPENYTYRSDKDKYSTNNTSFINNLSSEMREKTKQLIAYANANGYDIRITSGKRTEADQQKLIERDEQNGTNLAARSNSPHLSGIAIDIEVYKDGKKLDNNSSDIVAYAKTTLGMRWGGDFVNWTKEPWHFDLRKA